MKNNYESIDWSQWARLLVKKAPMKFMNGHDVVKCTKRYDRLSEKLVAELPFLKKALPRLIKKDLYN